MNLDDLVKDAVKRKGEKKRSPRRSSRPEPTADYQRTKEELRQLMLDACVPTSVHLMITEQRCECGEVYQSVNALPLVKCVGEKLTHFKGVESYRSMQEYDHLPKVIDRKVVDIPYCETCFVNAREGETETIASIFDWSTDDRVYDDPAA